MTPAATPTAGRTVPASPSFGRRAPVAEGRRARRDDTVRVAAGAALWLALLLVSYWWVAGRGLQDLLGWGSGLTSFGRLTGLVASVLLLAQVLLMSRLPWLEAAFGQDRLARQHRLVGFVSFTLMVAHVALVTWGYAAGDLAAAPGTLWNLTVSYPGMLLAAAGTACLCLVVVTSVRAARRRLRYESWHLLHLYAYLGVGLALPHQLWTGQELVSSPGRAVFWWAAWAAAAASVLVWRVAIPVIRTLVHDVRVVGVVPEGPGVVSVHMTGRRLDRLGAEAGQFLTWRFLGRTGWTRANPYSLSAAPDGRSLRITVADAGDGSRSLAALRPGTRVVVEGPHGRLSERARTRDKVALIGAGVGIAPLRALAEGLRYERGGAVLVHRYTEHALFAHELHALEQQRGLRVVSSAGRRRHPRSWLGDGPGGGNGRPGAWSDLAVLRHWIPDLVERDVYVCGPGPWADLVCDDLLLAGLTPDQVHVETFGW